MRGDERANPLLSDGTVVVNGGAGTLSVVFDGTNTIVIPEPAPLPVPTIFSDDFEDQAVGSEPDGWTVVNGGAGSGEFIRISTNEVAGGTNSCHIHGVASEGTTQPYMDTFIGGAPQDRMVIEYDYLWENDHYMRSLFGLFASNNVAIGQLNHHPQDNQLHWYDGAAWTVYDGVSLASDTWYHFTYTITTNAVTLNITDGILNENLSLNLKSGYSGEDLLFIRFGTARNDTDADVYIDNVSITTTVPHQPSTIISLSHHAGNVLEMVVDCPTPWDSYPKMKTDLVAEASWDSVGHSTNSAGPFTTNNLGTVPGTISIYLEANDAAAFFGIGEE